MTWRTWAVTDWNERLLRHFFFAPAGSSSGPILQLVVTAEEFARVAGEDEGRASEVQRAFISAMQQELSSSGLLLGGAARRAARKWDEVQEADPPFVAHLLVACLAASDISEERAAEGDFRKRLDQLLVRENSQHALGQLPSLWSRLADWLGRASQRRRGSRELVLPEVGNYRIIGIPLYLSFPPRRDELLLVRLLADQGLGDEPPLRAVLKCIEGRASAFSPRFRKAFEEFRRAYEERSPSINRSPFWSAVRGAALAGIQKERAELGSATLWKHEESDEGHFRLAVVLDDRAASSVLPPFGKAALDEPISGYSNVLTCHKNAVNDLGDIEEPVTLLLAEKLSPSRIWRRLVEAIRDGVLLFPTDDEGVTSLSLRLPDVGGSVDVLVRDELAASLVGALPVQPAPHHHRESRYARWREVRAVNTVDLARIDFALTPVLASVRCLQQTLAPAVARLKGGIRLDGGAWLGTPAFLPSVAALSANTVTLKSPDAMSPPVALRQESSDSGVWVFPNEALDGQYELVVRGLHSSPSMSVTFRSSVLDVEYREPKPGKWISEGYPTDVANIEGPLTNGHLGITQPAQTSWIAGDQVSPEEVDRGAGDCERVDQLTTALAAISVRRTGISEAALLDIVGQAFPGVGQLRWDILRAWVEVGAVSRLVSRSWRSAAYFAVRPYLVVHRSATGCRATLMGLAPPSLRRHVIEAAHASHVRAELEWRAASIFTPPLLRLAASGAGPLVELASRAGLRDVEWLRPPEEALQPVARVLAEHQKSEPKNYEIMGHWDWQAMRFVNGADGKRDTVVLEWRRRPDAPDYFLLSNAGSVVWWGRSRVWAIHAMSVVSDRPICLNGGDGSVECVRPGEGYLPLGAARFAVAAGASPPGPLPDRKAYRYPFVSAWLQRLVVQHLWPKPLAPDPALVSRLRWLEDASRGVATGLLVAVPPHLRALLMDRGGREGLRLSTTTQIPIALLPLFLALGRRLRDVPVD
jgi:hypothetical protein